MEKKIIINGNETMISSEEWRNIYKKPVGIKLYVYDLKETNIK